MAQVVECMLHKGEALISNPSPTKTKMKTKTTKQKSSNEKSFHSCLKGIIKTKVNKMNLKYIMLSGKSPSQQTLHSFTYFCYLK
jgi:hypothetical protein